MFSEFLCSQLFYGDLSDKELADGTSQFQSNKLGIFENLGLIVDPDPETSDDRADGQVKISPEAVYEIISGAAIAFAALLLIVPGFATDLLGFLLIFPLTRKLFFGKIISKFKSKTKIKKPYIDGEFEDIEEEDDRKL